MTMTNPTPKYWAVTDKRSGKLYINPADKMPLMWNTDIRKRGWVAISDEHDMVEHVLIPAADYAALLATREAARTLVSGANGKSYTTEFGECYVPQDADFERLAGVVEHG